MIDYSSSKQTYNQCSKCGYSEREASYSLGNIRESHIGNYSGSSNSYDVGAKS